jgi:hypothetical protein
MPAQRDFPVQPARSVDIPPAIEEDESDDQDDARALAGAMQLLETSGMREVVNKNDDGSLKVSHIELIREQLRGAAAILANDCPEAFSPTALKAQRETDLEQYLAFTLKRFSHVHELNGYVTLPSGKQLKLEGFFDVFTAPMVMSSFRNFAKDSLEIPAKLRKWILRQFQKIRFSDYISKKDIEELVPTLQSADFDGAILQSIGFDIHCAVNIWYKDLLFYCDRGSDHIQHGIYVLKVPNRDLITEDFLWERIKTEEIKEKDYDILNTLVTELGAEVVHYEPMSSQSVGNCSYATMEAALFALMAIEKVESGKIGHQSQPWMTAFYGAKRAFQKWTQYDHESVFDSLMEEIEEWLADKDGFGKHDLKQTYQEVLTYWRHQPQVHRTPAQIAKADALLPKLM